MKKPKPPMLPFYKLIRKRVEAKIRGKFKCGYHYNIVYRISKFLNNTQTRPWRLRNHVTHFIRRRLK